MMKHLDDKNSRISLCDNLLLKIRFLSSALLVATQAGCGGGNQLAPNMEKLWQWDGGVEASRVLSSIENEEVPDNVPAAVGVTGRGLVGRTLPDGKLWKYDGPVDVLPTLVGDAVLFSGGGKVTMLDVRSGKVRFSVDSNQRRLEGAGFDGRKAVLLLVDKDNAREDQIRVIGSGGRSHLAFTSIARVGTPAAVSGIGLVPYNGQYVGGFDLDTGKMVGRVLLRDGLHSVRSENGSLTLYGAGATRLTKEVTSNPDSESLRLSPRQLPGKPSWPLDGSKPRAAKAQPIQIYAHPNIDAGTLVFAGNGYAASYFEIVVGFDHGSNSIRWTTHFKRSVAGGAASRTGSTLCLEDGSLFHVGWKDGGREELGSLESRLKACVVTASKRKMNAGSRPPLFDQIVETLTQTGPDMVTMQNILIDELTKVQSNETAKALLAIAQNPLVATNLAVKAGMLLAEQEHGGAEMIQALRDAAPNSDPQEKPGSPASDSKNTSSSSDSSSEKKIDDSGSNEWIDETDAGSKSEIVGDPETESVITGTVRTQRPPPVAALARALSRLKTKGAAGALAAYLADASLAPSDIRAVMMAVAALGNDQQIPAVQKFLQNYKNTGGEADLLDALGIAAGFLYAHLDADGRQVLKEALDQSLTHPLLKKRTADLQKLAEKHAPGTTKRPTDDGGHEEEKTQTQE